jgi:hypothetical protein
MKKPAANKDKAASEAANEPGSPELTTHVLRDHNKMQWVAAQMKKGSMNKQFSEVFANAEKMSKLKGTQLVNECVVRDIQGRWTIDCQKPVFQDCGLLL